MNLAQLQRLAERGSRRARLELDARMHAVDALPVPSPMPTPAPTKAQPHGATVLPGARTPAAPEAPVAGEALARQLHAIAQQDQARARADGPPRLVGLVLLAWGALLLLGGLLMVGRGGGLYYLFCGLGAALVGWLLMQRSRWAMVMHVGLLLLALGWAWAGAARHHPLLTLVQAAPLLIPALWMVLRQVREPLR